MRAASCSGGTGVASVSALAARCFGVDAASACNTFVLVSSLYLPELRFLCGSGSNGFALHPMLAVRQKLKARP